MCHAAIPTDDAPAIRIDAIPPALGWRGLALSRAQGTPPYGRHPGASLVLNLVEKDELDGVVPLHGETPMPGRQWCHLPIRDRYPPGEEFERDWPTVLAEIHTRLDRGGRVLLRCRNGLGRAGTVAACVLVETGLSAEEAVARVRAIDPWAIENAMQEWYVVTYRPALQQA